MRLDSTNEPKPKPFFHWFIPVDLALEVCQKLIELERLRIKAEQEGRQTEAADRALVQDCILQSLKEANLTQLKEYVSDHD